MQGHRTFFCGELVIVIYLLISQGVMSEKFLMPSLENISKRYGLNSGIAGLLIAIGVSIPELVVTILSFSKHGTKMTEFGLATVFGSVCFATTFIPAAAYLMNYGIRNPRPTETPIEKQQRDNLLPQYLRDMTFIIVGLSMFWYCLKDNTIKFSHCLSFFFLSIIYITLTFSMQYQRSLRDAEQAKKKEEENESGMEP